MKKQRFGFRPKGPAFAALLLLLAAGAQAAMIYPGNLRPVPVTIPSVDGPGTDLQAIVGRSGLDATGDQNNASMWRSATPVIDAALPVVTFEYADNPSINTFGIWSVADDGALSRVEIFNGAARRGSWALLGWTLQGDLAVLGNPAATNVGVFGGISPLAFGFYTGNGSGGYHYTADLLNPGGRAEALAYNVPGSSSWIMAFEEVGSTDGDFNDLVVRVALLEAASSAPVPTPLPAAVWLLASGLLAFAGLHAKAGPWRWRQGWMRAHGLLGSVAFTLLLAGCATQPGRVAEEAPASPGMSAAAEKWGLEIRGLRLTAADYVLDLRYRVLDARKAAAIVNPKTKPYLVTQASGAMLQVPNSAKVGPLRQTRGTPIPGRTYFMFFANPGQHVKSGEKVTLVMGDMVVENLVVQ